MSKPAGMRKWRVKLCCIVDITQTKAIVFVVCTAGEQENNRVCVVILHNCLSFFLAGWRGVRMTVTASSLLVSVVAQNLDRR